MRNWYY